MQSSSDPQVGSFYVCEKCDHIFNWATTRYLARGTSPDGVRCCPRCQTEFVRKFRESDNQKILDDLVCPDVVLLGSC